MKTTSILAAALIAVAANAAPTPASIDAVNSANGGSWGKRELTSVDEANVIHRSEKGVSKSWGKREVASVDDANVIHRSEEGLSKSWGKREVASVDEANVIHRSASTSWGKK